MNGGLVLVFYGRGQPMVEMMAMQRGKYHETAHGNYFNTTFGFVKIQFTGVTPFYLKCIVVALPTIPDSGVRSPF